MRRHNLKRLWREIDEIASPQLRLERAREIGHRIDNHLEELRSQKRRLTETVEVLRHHPGNASPQLFKLAGLRGLAILLVVLDIPVQLLLNSAALPDVESWKVALASVALALGIAGAVHLVLVHLIHDPDRPARTIRLCRMLAGVSFLATAAGATVFLFARQASPEMAAHLVTLTAVALWTVAEALPMAAGFFSAWAHVLAEPVRAERALRKVRNTIGTYSRFSDRLDAEERRLTKIIRTNGRTAATTGQARQIGFFSQPAKAGREATTLMVAMLALGIWSGIARAQEIPEPTGRLCAIFVDRTLSVDPVHREEALRLLLDGLPTFIEETGCTELLVGTFADEGAWTPQRWFRVPGGATRDCEDAAPEGQVGAAGLLANLRGFRDHFHREAVEECMAELEAFGALRASEGAALYEDVGRALSAPQLTEETRTDIVGLVESLVGSGVSKTVLVTDGLDTAHEGLESVRPPEGDLILILVPAGERYGGRDATNEASELWRRAGARTLPYTALVVPGAWARLIHEGR